MAAYEDKKLLHYGLFLKLHEQLPPESDEYKKFKVKDKLLMKMVIMAWGGDECDSLSENPEFRTKMKEAMDAMKDCNTKSLESGSCIMHLEISSLEGFTSFWLRYLDTTLLHIISSVYEQFRPDVRVFVKLDMTEEAMYTAVDELGDNFLGALARLESEGEAVSKTLNTILHMIAHGDFKISLRQRIQKLIAQIDNRLHSFDGRTEGLSKQHEEEHDLLEENVLGVEADVSTLEDRKLQHYSLLIQFHEIMSPGSAGCNEFKRICQRLVTADALSECEDVLDVLEVLEEHEVIGVGKYGALENLLVKEDVAASRGAVEDVRNLITSRQPTDDEVCQAVISSCRSGKLDVLKILLHQLSIERCDETTKRGLELAAGYGCQQVVQYLLDNYYSPCKRLRCACRLALMSASWGGQDNITRVLLSHGADINTTDKNGATCLLQAAGYGHTDTVRYLISHGADPDKKDNNGWTSLHWAARWGHKDTVSCLVNDGADVNTQDNYGLTFLHWCARWGHTDVVRYLVTRGADINSTAHNGATCLHWAASEGHTGTVSYLLTAEADIYARKNDGETCLHSATQNGHTETVRYLVTQRAFINARNISGATCLHLAANYGETNIVRYLITRGAKTNIRDNWGRIASDLAIEKGYKEINELLTKFTHDETTQMPLAKGIRTDIY